MGVNFCDRANINVTVIDLIANPDEITLPFGSTGSLNILANDTDIYGNTTTLDVILTDPEIITGSYVDPNITSILSGSNFIIPSGTPV